MSANRVAIVGARSECEMHADDALLCAALGEVGATAQYAPWDDPTIDWRAFDVAVVRSTWNYHLQPVAFSRWLDTVVSCGVHLVNSAHAIRWNLHKGYLLELAQAGVAVIETQIVRVASADELRVVLQASEHGGELVVKPAISASAHRTHRVAHRRCELPQDLAIAAADGGEWVIQPFVPEVQERGELSAICIDGAITHLVRKLARSGDFRVQSDFGGTVSDESLGADSEHFVRSVLDALPIRWTFARVDWVDEPHARLMEVELIEPELFLSRRPAAAQRLAAAVSRHEEH